jgi:dihydrolipoamide dehydrogenase
MTSYDLIVIGSGPGGYVAAIRGAQLGMRSAVVEQDELGGVCLNWGCIPTKAILHSAEQYEAVRHGVPGLIVDGLRPDWPAVIDASRRAAGRLNKGVQSLLRKNRVDVLKGRGSLAGKGQVKVQSGEAAEVYGASQIILATGSTEWVFPGVTVDGERILTSREALASKELPDSILIVGGGAVGLEFAYAYASFGTRVTLIELQPQILPGFDRETAEELARAFARRGIEVRTSTAYKGVETSDGGVVVTVDGEKGEQEIAASKLLLAVGRRALVQGLGLEEAGVTLERGFVKIDAQQRTSAPGIWAIGDCAGPPLLAHKASHEGVAAVEFMAGVRRHPIDPRRIPGNFYCQPQVGTIGWSEAQAREAGRDVRVGRVPYAASGKAVGAGHTEGFLKLVADARHGEVLGCQILGYGATEMINEVSLAMALECTTAEIAEACHAHPTLAELLAEAALAAEGRSINT